MRDISERVWTVRLELGAMLRHPAVRRFALRSGAPRYEDRRSFAVMRIDRASGKTIWKVDRPTTAIRESPDSYTTPALLRYGKATEIVITEQIV